MTSPLAMKVLKDLSRRESDREYDLYDLEGKLYDFHCFEVSDIHSLADEMALQIVNGSVPYDCGFTFLPAARTWIEWKDQDDGCRRAFFLEQETGKYGEYAKIVEVVENQEMGRIPEWVNDELRSATGEVSPKAANRFGQSIVWEKRTTANELGYILPLLDPSRHPVSHAHLLTEARQQDLALIAVLLSLINTPRTIGRRQHMPHRGLQKTLLKSRAIIGKFPLHAWTEILLHVTETKDLSNNESVEAHLTGSKALHFCRAHLRVKYGRVEVVRGHWRGDASLGIKRSRYKVTA
jgi:hypothetical protein